MIEQLKTIQTGLAIAIDAEGFVDKPVRRALLDAVKAAAQLEAMVGKQEPVACVGSYWNDGKGFDLCDFSGNRPAPGAKLYAAPVAQQPTFDARRALEAIEALLSNIRRDAPSLSGKVMGFAEEVAAALRDKVAQQPQAEAVPIGVVVAIDASDPENGPDAIVALHCDVALGAKLYAQPPSRSAEIAELKEALRISLENYEFQRKKAERATDTVYKFHYAMKDAGWHPGRTDDKLTDIIRAKGEYMRVLEADTQRLRKALKSCADHLYRVASCGDDYVVASAGHAVLLETDK